MHYLWCEKYRPTTLDGYVFKDDYQREQVEGWVKDGEIPHILFSGSPGVGKCLGGDELIRVEIKLESLTKNQKIILEKYRIS